MRVRGLSLVVCLAFTACSSTSDDTAPSQTADAGPDTSWKNGPAAGGVTERGVVMDYGTMLTTGQLVPVEGLTVTDGDQTATTDANGAWSITLPAGSTFAPVLTGTAHGDAYSSVFLPEATPVAGADLDRGNLIVPDVSTFQLERLSLSADSSLAIVHVVVLATGSCTDIVGGTLTVTSPPGAKVMNFDAKGYPSSVIPSFIKPQYPDRPVADIYDLPVGSDIAFHVDHPTCKQTSAAVVPGGTFTGKVTTKAAEPGDNNSALVVTLE